MDQKGISKWIWINEEKTDDLYGEFYTTFECQSQNAKIHISVDSDYTLFINGEFVDCGQYPDFPHYKVYDEIDLSKHCIKGENKLAIIVWHYGTYNMSYYPGNPALKFEVYEDDNIIAYSDIHTMSRKSKAYKSGLKKIISSQLGYSFLYNSTCEDEWKNGVLVDFFQSCIVNQDLPLFKRTIKKLRIEPMKKSTLIKSKDDYHLYDLGEEEVGFLTLKVSSNVEQKLTICYGEHIADGNVRRIIGQRDFSVEVVVKNGVTEYTNYFRRLGLRYLEVHFEKPIEIEYVSVLPCPYPLNKIKKDFKHELTNKIYDTSVRTLELCLHSHYEDCPWREQALYAMDSRNQMLCGYFSFGEYDFPRNNLYLMSKDNRSDGLLSICIPTYYGMTIPSFSLHYFLAVYEYTVYSKDVSLAKEVYPKLKSIISAFMGRMNEGLVGFFEGEKNYWNFYEWRDGLDGKYRDGILPKTEAALNCLFSLALQYFEKICKLINAAFEYTNLIDELNRNIYKTFFDKEKGLLRNRTDKEDYSELVNSLAILCNVVSGKEAENISSILASDNNLTKVSLSMKCFKYDALIETDKDKYKDYILNDIKGVYQMMLDAGATSFWETEEGEKDFADAGSLCHGWSAMPVYYYNILL